MPDKTNHPPTPPNSLYCNNLATPPSDRTTWSTPSLCHFGRPTLPPRHRATLATVALLDDDGDVVERYEYDAYGACRITDDSYGSPQSASSYANPYLFTGRRLDILDSGSLKLQYNRNRYYDPETGRWLTHDPLGITPPRSIINSFWIEGQYTDGMNLYEYARGNPAANSDSYGLGFGWIPNGPTLRDVQRYCSDWIKKELKFNENNDWLNKLPDCPRKIQKIGGKWISPRPKKWTKPKKASQRYHKCAEMCMRSKGGKGMAGQQCCYDKKGKLITKGSGAGTPDKVSPGKSWYGHLMADVLIFESCIKYLGNSWVNEYHRVRPPNTGELPGWVHCP